MKNIFRWLNGSMAIVVVLSLLITLNSCSWNMRVEKRRYAAGYYWHGNSVTHEGIAERNSRLENESAANKVLQRSSPVQTENLFLTTDRMAAIPHDELFVFEDTTTDNEQCIVTQQQQPRCSSSVLPPKGTVFEDGSSRITRNEPDPTDRNQSAPYKVWLFILFLLGLLIINAIGFLLLLVFAAIMDNYSTEKNAGAWTLIIGSALLLLADAIMIGQSIKRRRAKMKEEESSTTK